MLDVYWYMLISVCLDWIAGVDRWFGDVYSEGLW